MNTNRMLSGALAAALSLPALCSFAANANGLLGEQAVGAKAQRTIVITPNTRSVNIQGGQIVKFVAGKKSFTWDFDGSARAMKLNRIAPHDMLNHTVTAYVSPNPLYQGGAS
jgi:hypothetical protein